MPLLRPGAGDSFSGVLDSSTEEESNGKSSLFSKLDNSLCGRVLASNRIVHKPIKMKDNIILSKNEMKESWADSLYKSKDGAALKSFTPESPILRRCSRSFLDEDSSFVLTSCPPEQERPAGNRHLTR